MRKRLEIFHKYLPSGGHCIIVVGDSETGGRKVPTVGATTWLAQELGFKFINTSHCNIKNRVMQFPVKSNSEIEKESIIVLQKG